MWKKPKNIVAFFLIRITIIGREVIGGSYEI